jgi:signal transduction histidine kinase/ActR/RegA family two-component response regulator
MQLPIWLRKHAFVVAAAFLFAVIAVDGLISLHELGTVIDRFLASRSSDNILEEMNETLGALRDAETGQRGYLLTGRAAYLQPYYDGRARVTQHLEQLRILTAADPIRGPRVRSLRQAVEAKLDELAGTITRYRSDGPQAALGMVLTNQGNDLMIRIRRLAVELTNQERQTRAIHRAAATASSGRASVMIGLTSVIAALLLLITLSQIARATGAERDARERAEAAYAAETQARLASESANRIKDEFIATVSHELRTPLTAILGWSRILVNECQSDLLQEGLHTIQSCASAQAKLIDDLLDVSRVMSGKMRLSIRTIGMAEVIRAAVDSVRPAAEARGVALHLHLDDEIRVSADPDRLQQIVWNLVSNAVKFTPRGGRIDVRLRRTDSQAVLSVEDSGEGIDPDFLPHVFDAFRQADASKARVHKGLGLGLSIVSNLVQAHGGTVAVSSGGKGEGAAFSVALPIMPFTRGEAVAEPSAAIHASRNHDEWPIVMPQANALAGMTILAVDDHRPTLDLLAFVLRAAGATVVPAINADDGYRLLQLSKPDVVLSDVGMPGEDGLTFIGKIRRLSPERGGDVPAVALTAYVRQDDRDKVLSSGFQAYLSKPIEPMVLVSSILEVASQQSTMKGLQT